MKCPLHYPSIPDSASILCRQHLHLVSRTITTSTRLPTIQNRTKAYDRFIAEATIAISRYEGTTRPCFSTDGCIFGVYGRWNQSYDDAPHCISQAKPGLASSKQTVNASHTIAAPPVTNIGVLVFPAFQAIDVFGPLDALNLLSLQRQLNLYIIAETLEPVSTAPRSPAMNKFNSSFGERVLPTHDFEQARLLQLDALLIPGGIGTRAPDLNATIQFVADVYPRTSYLVAPCTGAGIAARAGVLDGKRATTNKRSWNATVAYGPKTYWVAHARWVQDGNVFTGSGVTAAIDTAFAWIAYAFGETIAADLALGMEYERHMDPARDPFAIHYGVTDVPPIAQSQKEPQEGFSYS